MVRQVILGSTDEERRRSLETIVSETERLRDIAKADGFDFLAFLLENVLLEARSTLIGQGHEPPTRAPSDAARPPFRSCR